MKKFFFVAIMAMMCSSLSAQTVASALKNLNAFVDSLNVTENTTKEELEVIKDKYSLLKDDYKKVKKLATMDEIEEYSRITTRYRMKTSVYYSNKAGETLDGVAESVSKWTKRQYRKAKGMVKGVNE